MTCGHSWRLVGETDTIDRLERVRERAPRSKGDRSDRPKGVRYEWRRVR